MKKIFYILAAMLLVATACSRNDLIPAAEQDGDRITFTMNLNVPMRSIGTKAMGDKPGNLNVYVFVFGQKGNLNDFVQAIPTGKGDFEQDENEHYYKQYAISLKKTDSEQHVHVMATNDTHDFTELLGEGSTLNESMMDAFQTTGTEDGYWQYLSLPKGTNAAGAAAAFNNLKLVRNFAKITVDFAEENPTSETATKLSLPEGVSNFKFLGFEVYNKPTTGSYVLKKGEAYYPEYVNYDANNFNALLQAYPGYMINATDIDTKNEGKFEGEGSDGKLFIEYLYERTAASMATNPTYLMLKCSYDDAAVEGDSKNVIRYYRIDIVDQNEDYLPIYRNFLYALRITSIGKKGYASVEEAAKHTSNGNISLDVATEHLQDISDGVSRMYVQFIEKVFVKSTVAQEGKFRYKYLPNAENESVSVAATLTTPDNTSLVTVPDDWTTGGTVDNKDKWYDLTFTVQPDVKGITTFSVTGVNPKTNKKLVRKIRINILDTQTFTITAQPGSISPTGTGTIKFKFDDSAFVKKDDEGNDVFVGLPSSMFPIEMLFEDTAKALNPDFASADGKDMIASGGKSLVPNSNVNAVQFKKTITYDEYVNSFTGTGSGEFSATFKRIATGSTTMYIGNQYFTTKSITIN